MSDNNIVPSFGIVDERPASLGADMEGFLNDDPDTLESVEDKKEPEKKEPEKKEPLKKDPPKKDTLDLKDIDKKEGEEEEEEVEEEEEDGEINYFETFSKELVNLGVLLKDEENDTPLPKTPEEFLQLFRSNLDLHTQNHIDSVLGRYGDEYHEAFENIFIKGINPREYYQAQHELEDFSNIDLTQEDNQVAVVKQALKDLGYEAEEIKEEVERLKTYQDLEAAAKRHHSKLVRSQQQKIADKAAQEQQKREQALLGKKEFATSVNKILSSKLEKQDFDGIPVNKKLAEEVQQMLVAERWKLPNGELITDFDKEILDLKRPENHTKKVKVAMLLRLLDTDPTLSTIKKADTSKTSNKLFSELTRQKNKKESPVPAAKEWEYLK